MSFDVARNQGALLLGGYFAAWLSGFVVVQTIIYFKLYPSDPLRTKALVSFVWVLDCTHSGLVLASVWTYLIQGFGAPEDIDDIPLTLSLTIVFTAISTFAVHCFFAHRIFLLSKKNWYLTTPIVVLATFRLGSAAATSSEMIRLGEFSTFKAQFRWLFSLGLALSSTIDIFVTLSLFALLQHSKSRSLRSEKLDHIIDSLVLYTFETGSLTSAATVSAMICWLAMNNNLVFMGLHFVIGKLYANSLLAALNTRHELRQAHSSHDLPALNFDRSLRRMTDNFRSPYMISQTSSDKPAIQLQHVQINVEKSVTYERD